MTYVRSLRQPAFDLYVEILCKMSPWFFALDHVNYARWSFAYVENIISLEDIYPEGAEHFRKGVTVRKSQRPFSATATDQAHEQYKASMKENEKSWGF